jgi:hypothetical protein
MVEMMTGPLRDHVMVNNENEELSKDKVTEEKQ